jgi:short subunit dehydrogenase-like uncharacterized protein
MAQALIYGATGYTGRMLARRAARRGLDFAVGGRSRDKVQALADELGVEGIVLEVEDTERLRAALAGIRCVLSAAGPFSATAQPLMAACLAGSVHYLDTTGEIGVFAHGEALDHEAAAAGVMLMPGVGWDVVSSDCIALHVARRVPDPQLLRIGLAHIGAVPSRGTLRTGLAIMSGGAFIRRDGELLRLAEPLPPRVLDFGYDRLECSLTPMGDLVTAYKSTGVRNIEVYSAVRAGGLKLPPGGIEAFPEGPTVEQLAAWRAFATAEVVGAHGSVARSVMETVSGYDFTALAGIEILERVLRGELRSGFQSPASAYGVELATGLGARITDLS